MKIYSTMIKNIFFNISIFFVFPVCMMGFSKIFIIVISNMQYLSSCKLFRKISFKNFIKNFPTQDSSEARSTILWKYPIPM